MEDQDAPGTVAPLLRDVRLLSATETNQYGTIEPPRLVQDDDFPSGKNRTLRNDPRLTS